MIKSFKLTVEKRHADEAFKALNNVSICKRCVIAQALSETFPDVQVGYHTFQYELNNKVVYFGCDYPNKMEKITTYSSNQMGKIDIQNEIKSLLPMELEFFRFDQSGRMM